MKSILMITGPTAAGKTALATGLADRYPVTLINMDSAQVYRCLDIGSAKPEPDILARYPHQLIDQCEPEESYSVAQFRADAKRAIESAWQQSRWPLLVGGTPLYIRALLYGLDDLPDGDPEVRASLQERGDAEGWAKLHEALGQVDPESAKRIAPRDRQRIARALEVYQLTGRPLSELRTDNREANYPALRIVVTPQDRAQLHRRIGERFDQMMAAGFDREVEQLMARPGLSADHPSMKSVGYRQMWSFLGRERDDREQLRESVIAATRQLAKRQLTALRKLHRALWYDSTGSQLFDQVATCVERFVDKNE